MKILGVSAEDFREISIYMTAQKAYWYPEQGVVTYYGYIFKLFFIDESSPHVSYLMMKYKIKDFSKLWHETRYHHGSLDFMK